MSSSQSLLYIHPKRRPLTGSIHVPGSKSYAIRVLALALLNFGRRTILQNYGPCDDVQSAIRVIRTLGASVAIFPDRLEIEAPSRAAFFANRFRVLDVGESALCGRMFGIIGALTSNRFSLVRRGSLASRSFAPFEEIFAQLQVKFSLEDLSIQGPIAFPKFISIDASTSSQYLSGLLIASMLSPEPMQIEVQNLVSQPYIDLTLHLLLSFFPDRVFAPVLPSLAKGKIYQVSPMHSPRVPEPLVLHCEGDWSLAANFIVAAALWSDPNSAVAFHNLSPQSLQADFEILSILHQLAVPISWQNSILLVSKLRSVPIGSSIFIDITDCPDLYPLLTLLEDELSFTFKFHGLDRLHNKESDRSTGYLSGDLSDHRIFFASALAARLSNKNHITSRHLKNANSFNKSCSQFLSLLASL